MTDLAVVRRCLPVKKQGGSMRAGRPPRRSLDKISAASESVTACKHVKMVFTFHPTFAKTPVAN